MQSLIDIYEWISSFKKTHSNTEVYGKIEYDKSDHFSIFTFLKHLMMPLKYKFSGLQFDTLSKKLIACRAMQLSIF